MLKKMKMVVLSLFLLATLAEVSNADTIVASWPAEYTPVTQGDNWSYWSAKADGTNYGELEWLELPEYLRYGRSAPYVSSGMVFPYEDAIVRWDSEVASDLRITGSFQKKYGHASYGEVTVEVRVDGNALYSILLPNSDNTVHAFDVTALGVQVGDDVDFVVYSMANSTLDETYLENIVITELPPPLGTVIVIK